MREAYNMWSEQYDTNINRTRDLEAIALRKTLSAIPVKRCLEIGCGTGKNTEWLVNRCKEMTCVDLSEEMLQKAKQKISSEKACFYQADITFPWTFVEHSYDLVSFSLVLEHIEDLDHIFNEAANTMQSGGYLYIGELHPFKQYSGTKARFDTEAGQYTLNCFTHPVSEFVQTAKKYGLILTDLNEYFDNNNRSEIPRILTLLFRLD